jgi:hypothetical protein
MLVLLSNFSHLFSTQASMGIAASKNNISKNIAPTGKIMGSDNSSGIMVTTRRF